MILMVLQTPPAAATRPWLPHRQSGCRWGKDMWGFCWRTTHRPRPGRDGKQSVKRMTRGKNINQRSPRRHSGNTIRVVNLTKLLTDSANIARKKTLQTPKRDPKCAPHLWGHEKKSWRTPKKDFGSHFVFELALTANWGDYIYCTLYSWRALASWPPVFVNWGGPFSRRQCLLRISDRFGAQLAQHTWRCFSRQKAWRWNDLLVCEVQGLNVATVCGQNSSGVVGQLHNHLQLYGDWPRFVCDSHQCVFVCLLNPWFKARDATSPIWALRFHGKTLIGKFALLCSIGKFALLCSELLGSNAFFGWWQVLSVYRNKWIVWVQKERRLWIRHGMWKKASQTCAFVHSKAKPTLRLWIRHGIG